MKNKFPPIHFQLNLTNRCQLNCNYCSCEDRDRTQEMSPSTLDDFCNVAARLGTEAVTITGGGEPLLYPHFDKVVEKLSSLGIFIGLVTNGIALSKWPPYVYRLLSWIRISFDADRNDTLEIPEEIFPSFSYVFRKGNENDPKLQNLIEMAKENKIEHLRIVTDIIYEKDSNALWPLSCMGLPSNIILQDRTIYNRGTKNCWIHLVKPVMDADGIVYPCCGAQYALNKKCKGFPIEMRIGHIKQYEKISCDKKPFNGSICVKCYYSQYNELLEKFNPFQNIKHLRFI